MTWHLAAVWETISDAVPDASALLNGGVRRSWRDYEERAARLASALAAQGHCPGCKVGIYAHNSNEHLEAQFGVLKLGGGPVNVNYRYTEQELVYLLDNADAEALVFDAQFADRVDAIQGRLPGLRTLIEIDDGSGRHLDGALPFEDAVSANAPPPRRAHSEDDVYMLYTGGTTGMPKGVMYRQGDFTASWVTRSHAAVGLPPPASHAELAAQVRRLHAEGRVEVGLPACPLMHATGLWGGVFSAHMVGGCAVTLRNEHFDAHALWKVVEEAKVTFISIVGDAFARPMLKALEEAAAAGRAYDLSSLRRIRSSGVMFSREAKEGLLKFADISILDTMGATEGGMGTSVVSRASPPGETARFAMNPTTRVFADDGREVRPGSDEIGMIANGGLAPLGYYKDPEKSARTFREVGGHRYSFPGDLARLASDGSLILLGRGSGCINTGGEKVFPEEVEEALKAHPAVADCLVVGTPDERFGQRVTAVLSRVPGGEVDEAALITFARTRIAGYKTPRRVVVVDEVRRAPNGKADYAWARAVALEHIAT